MSLTDEERNTLVELQLEKSTKNLQQADEMIRLGYFDMAANRYYYSCFHALQALMIANGHFCHTHAGLIGEFGRLFIKTGIIDLSYGQFVSRLEQLRERGDYNCLYDVTAEDVERIVEPSHRLVELIKSMLK